MTKNGKTLSMDQIITDKKAENQMNGDKLKKVTGSICSSKLRCGLQLCTEVRISDLFVTVCVICNIWLDKSVNVCMLIAKISFS